jgi:hypothetical protein
MALAGQASTEMEAEHARSGLNMVTPRQDRTADVLSSVRQPALVARTNRAMRRQFEGMPGQETVGIAVFRGSDGGVEPCHHF